MTNKFNHTMLTIIGPLLSQIVNVGSYEDDEHMGIFTKACCLHNRGDDMLLCPSAWTASL